MQAQEYPLDVNEQVPPFKHGELEQAVLGGILQVVPVYPFTQVQRKEFPETKQVPEFRHGELWHGFVAISH